MSIPRLILMFLCAAMIAACQPAADQPLPTLISIESETEAEATPISATETPTNEPLPTATATPPMILGRYATDLAQIGYIRVFHAAPDVAAVDIYVQQASLAANVEYGLASGKTNIIAGSYDLVVTERGVSPDERVLTHTPFSIVPGQSLLVVFEGVPDALHATVYEESQAPLGSGRSRVNFIHAVALAPLVKGQLNGVDLSQLFDFGQASGGIEVSSTESTLGFATSEQPLASTVFNLMPRTQYTVILHGRSSDLENLAIQIFDQVVPGESRVRSINMVDGGAVDVYLDDALIADTLDYASASERLSITDGSHQVTVKLAGTDTTLIDNQTVNFTADDAVALIVMGTADSARVLAFVEDLTPLTAEQGRMAFINTLPAAQTAFVGSDAGLRSDLSGIGYGQGSSYVPVNIGASYMFWLDQDQNTVEQFTRVEVALGHSYLYMLTGSSEQPLLFAEPVEIVDASNPLALPEGDNILSTPVPTTYIRLINALEDGWAIDFMLNDTMLATGLAFGSSTDYIEIIPATHPVTVWQSGVETPVLQYQLPMMEPGTYSFFVYGPTYDLQFWPLSDAEIRTDSILSTVRLINVSLDETISVGLVDAEPTDGGSVPLPLDGQPVFRPSVPLNSNYLVREVMSMRNSIQAPINNGVRDWIVTDNRSHVVAQRLFSHQVEAGKHYDVVLVYRRFADEFMAFILPYSKPPAEN